MSKKNTIVLNHKNCFTKSKRISDLYLDFQKKILKLRTNKFLVAVSGGPDSLALSAVCKILSFNNKTKKLIVDFEKTRKKAFCNYIKRMQKTCQINSSIKLDEVCDYFSCQLSLTQILERNGKNKEDIKALKTDNESRQKMIDKHKKK